MQACERAGTALEEKAFYEKYPRGKETGRLCLMLDPWAMVLNGSCALEVITLYFSVVPAKFCVFLRKIKPGNLTKLGKSDKIAHAMTSLPFGHC